MSNLSLAPSLNPSLAQPLKRMAANDLSTQALFSQQVEPHTKTRTLAIEVSGFQSSRESFLKSVSEVAEILLHFSPRIAHRAVETRAWFFLDLGSHAPWIERNFGSEVRLLDGVFQKITDLGFSARAAIADTAPAAQAFAAMHSFWISSPGQTVADLDRLPLGAILHLEGLKPWDHPSRIDGIAGFFSLLGFRTVGDLRSFTLSVFQERWGVMGNTLFERLQARADLDPQPIAPFLPIDPLKSFVHLDFPVSVVSLLLHEIETSLKKLLARMEGRRLVVRRLRIKLRCEYSGHEHLFALEPSTPTRDFHFFRVLLENRLDRIELLNPIQDLEVEIDPLPEKETQNGFLDRVTADHSKLAILTSLLAQEGAHAGVATLQDEVWPENTWFLNPDITRGGDAMKAKPAADETERGVLDETGFAPRFTYARELEQSPRPTLLLKKPRLLDATELAKLHFYSGRPVERIEYGWWEGRAGPSVSLGGELHMPRRDYYIARDGDGRNLWLFQDSNDEKFYLHGAFD